LQQSAELRNAQVDLGLMITVVAVAAGNIRT
jgi:hypothetical protein